MIRQKVTPFLWFDNQAEEAANFYVSLFPDSAVTGVTPGPGGRSCTATDGGSSITGVTPEPGGAAMLVEFRLAGVQFFALNGGPHFQLTEAFSLSIGCHSQAEVDDYWEKLSAGGSTSSCGWLKDKFGLSWQVIPDALPRLLADPDREKAGRVMTAMMGMIKIDIQALEDAAAGK